MECADVHRRFAKEADADLIAATILDGEANAGCNGDVSADDTVTTEEVGFGIEEVHRAAFAARAAGVAPEQLGHDCTRTDSSREGLAVIAISGDDVVIGTYHRH